MEIESLREKMNTVKAQKVESLFEFWNKQEGLTTHRFNKKKPTKEVLKTYSNFVDLDIDFIDVFSSIKKFNDCFEKQDSKVAMYKKTYKLSLSQFLKFSKEDKERIEKSSLLKSVYGKIESVCLELYKNPSFENKLIYFKKKYSQNTLLVCQKYTSNISMQENMAVKIDEFIKKYQGKAILNLGLTSPDRINDDIVKEMKIDASLLDLWLPIVKKEIESSSIFKEEYFSSNFFFEKLEEILRRENRLRG